jgi:hypothetical protein
MGESVKLLSNELFTGTGQTLNRPHGPLLNAKAYSIGKSVCPCTVPRYRLRLPEAQVLGAELAVERGVDGDVPVGESAEVDVELSNG